MSLLIDVFVTLYVLQIIIVFLGFVIIADQFETKKEFLRNMFIPFYYMTGIVKYVIKQYKELK